MFFNENGRFGMETIVLKTIVLKTIVLKMIVLKMNNIKFTEYHMGLDYTREEVLEKYPTQKTLPIVLINDELIGGYTELFDRLRGKDEIQ